MIDKEKAKKDQLIASRRVVSAICAFGGTCSTQKKGTKAPPKSAAKSANKKTTGKKTVGKKAVANPVKQKNKAEAKTKKVKENNQTNELSD